MGRLSTFVDGSVVVLVAGRVPVVFERWQVLPLQGYEFQADMIAVGNRIFLRSGGHSFLSAIEICALSLPPALKAV